MKTYTKSHNSFVKQTNIYILALPHCVVWRMEENMKKILKMFLCMFVILSNMTLVDVKAESSSKIGDVVLEGDDQFDCDELFTEDSYDWNWLSTIGSRTVLLPSQNLNNKDFSLDFDLFVNKDDKKIRNFEKVKLGQDENSLKVANNLDYQWTPYCIKYNGTYDKGQTIKMTEFYNDKTLLFVYMIFLMPTVI